MNAEAWRAAGFRVASMADGQGRMRSAKNFDPSFRLGWNAEGLLVLLEVADDVMHDGRNPRHGDSIRIDIASGRDGGDRYDLGAGVAVVGSAADGGRGGGGGQSHLAESGV